MTTFSWQKVLGGEAAHGMLILSPRAVERLESHVPAWPLPKIFRLTKGGKLNEAIFRGETINTPSLLCVEDYLDALNWAGSIGGLDALIARADKNAATVAAWIETTPAFAFLAKDPATRSNTSVCLRFDDPAIAALPRESQAAIAKSIVSLVEREGAGYDFAAYRDAPPGLRIWCGATVEASDVALLTQWIDWAYAQATADLSRSVKTKPLPARPNRPLAKAVSPGLKMPPRVLISDQLSAAAIQIFETRGVDVDFQPALGKDKEKLAAVIGDYDGLAIRSATRVTADILAKAARLRVIGRAGIGVDNVDIPAATARGVIVMNTPFGNSVTTAEHAIALMFALARDIPAADASTQAGKWEKSRFMGVEITGKTLGVIGCGNIGAIVATRALGLKMRVIAFDPFLSAERATDARRRASGARRVAGARGVHHAAHAADRADPRHSVGGKPRQDAKGRAHHQLRARRPRG